MTTFRAQIPEPKMIQQLVYPSYDVVDLNNGIRFYCIEPSPLEVVKLNAHWKAGSIHETGKLLAKSSLSLALNGSEHNSAREILRQFEFWGSSFSPSAGILNSGFDLKSTKEFFTDTTEWFFKHFEAPVFPEEEMTTWKQTHAAELGRRMATPKYWAYRQCMELLFGSDSPMTRFLNPDDIGKLNVADVSDFKNKYYRSGAATYFISGDYDESILNFVKSVLGQFETQSVVDMPEVSEPADPGIAEIMHPVANTSQVSMFMARRIPEISETEYHHFSLLNTLLGGFFGSRLMQDIREEKGLTYGIGSYIQQTHNGNIWCISGEMNSANAGIALDETRKLLRGMISNPATGAELDRAKRYYTGQLRSGFDGPFSMAGKLRSLMSRNYTMHHFDVAMECIWNCTTQDLCDLADNYLHPETFKTVLAGDIK